MYLLLSERRRFIPLFKTFLDLFLFVEIRRVTSTNSEEKRRRSELLMHTKSMLCFNNGIIHRCVQL